MNRLIIPLSLISLVIKLCLALVFSGSTDIPNFYYASKMIEVGRSYTMNYLQPYYWCIEVARACSDFFELPFSFFFKSIHIFSELGLGLLLYREAIGQGISVRKSAWISFLYQTNLIGLLVTVFQGQMDSTVFFFVILAALLFQGGKKEAVLSGISYFISIGMKIYPIFLLPFFLFARGRSLTEKLYFLCGVIFTGLLTTGVNFFFSVDEFIAPFQKAFSYKSDPTLGLSHNLLKLWVLLGLDPLSFTSLIVTRFKFLIVLGLCVALFIVIVKKLPLIPALLGAILSAMAFSLNLAAQYFLWPIPLIFFSYVYGFMNSKRQVVWSGVFFYAVGCFLVFFFYAFEPKNSGTFMAAFFAHGLEPFAPHFLDRLNIKFMLTQFGTHGLWFLISGLLIAWVMSAMRFEGLQIYALRSGAKFVKPAIVILGCVLSLVTLVNYRIYRVSTPQTRYAELNPNSFSDYYNQYFYGWNRLITIHINPPDRPAKLSLQYPGADWYTIWQDGVIITRLKKGALFVPNHGGFIPDSKSFENALNSQDAKPDSNRINLMILDNITSHSVSDLIPSGFGLKGGVLFLVEIAA